MDYISHLDALNPEANRLFSSWSNYTPANSDSESLIEQLQTTLDIEQVLGIFLRAIANQYKINTVELETFHGKFEATNGQKSTQTITLPIRINDRLMGSITYFSNRAITDIMLSSLTSFLIMLVYPLCNASPFWQLH